MMQMTNEEVGQTRNEIFYLEKSVMTWSPNGTQILNNKTMKHTFTYFDYERSNH